MVNYKINYWKCCVCEAQITYEEEGEIKHHVHFDIERSKKDLYEEDGCIEEDLKNRNTKMSRMLCEDCFNDVLNDSPAFAKTFETDIFSKGKKQRIY